MTHVADVNVYFTKSAAGGKCIATGTGNFAIVKVLRMNIGFHNLIILTKFGCILQFHLSSFYYLSSWRACRLCSAKKTPIMIKIPPIANVEVSLSPRRIIERIAPETGSR
ncbi:MAG: hypothetical protein UY10_C0061G0004 [Microgenomates group bacterium GW2011_GWA2_47_8]|nr:MAG: hypothetical protein UY10_C0061G0004 [Microgenomates group bacterium GW2011_GWA2_47_8]